MPGLLAGGLGSAMLTPEEQMAMMEGQRKVAMTPTELEESRARAAVNAAQAQTLTQNLRKQPVTINVGGRPVTVSGEDFLQYQNQQKTRELEAQRIGIAQQLATLQSQKQAYEQDPNMPTNAYHKAQADLIQQKIDGLQNLSALAGDTQYSPATIALLQAHPEAISQLVRGQIMAEGGGFRKAKDPKDALVAATLAYSNMLANSEWGMRAKPGELQAEAKAAARALVEMSYKREEILKALPNFYSEGSRTPAPSVGSSYDKHMQNYMAQ